MGGLTRELVCIVGFRKTFHEGGDSCPDTLLRKEERERPGEDAMSGYSA